MEPEVEQFLRHAFEQAGSSSFSFSSVAGRGDGLWEAAIAARHGMLAFDDTERGHLTNRGMEFATSKLLARGAEPGAQPAATITAPGTTQTYSETFGIGGRLGPPAPRKLFSNEFFALAAFAAHGEDCRVELEDISLLTGIEGWRVLHAVKDLESHAEIDGMEVPGTGRLTDGGWALARRLEAERPQFATLRREMSRRVAQSCEIRSGLNDPAALGDDERAFLAAIAADNLLAYEPWQSIASRAGLAGDAQRAKAAYRGLVERDLLSADIGDPDRLRTTLPGADLARRLAAAAKMGSPAADPDPQAARETFFERFKRATDHEVIGGLTADAIKWSVVFVISLLMIGAVALGYVRRDSKFVRLVTAQFADSSVVEAGMADTPAPSAAPAVLPDSATLHVTGPQPSGTTPLAQQSTAPASVPATVLTEPPAAITPGALLLEIEVGPGPQHGQESRATDNFSVRAPAGAVKMFWTVTGGGDASTVRFNLTEDVLSEDGPRTLRLQDLRDIGRDQTVLPALRHGAVTDLATGDRLYISGVSGATSRFTIRVYAH
ncbi:MAG TPA: hypothetical protein VGN72_09600 [Tepidisphaeraceae bacterium]|nr:hypothetical protein [Tepidisphaeraceae bacterium]